VLALAKLAPFRNAFLLRGLAVWVFARLSLAFVGVADPNLAEEFVLLCIVPAAVFLDARRRSEDLVLGNLGIGALPILGWALPLAALAEMLVP
jgi:hypothetical protein